MSIRIAFPVVHISVRVFFLKGRRWSVIEHAVLASLCDKHSTAAKISVEAKLSQAVVVECLIRLMRAGWIELQEQSDDIFFRATQAGQRSAEQDELPRISIPMSRIGRVVICKHTGTCFNVRDLKIFTSEDVKKWSDAGSVIRLSDPENVLQGLQVDAFTTFIDEDEEYVRCDEIGARFSDRYAIVNVRANAIEGLPTNATEELVTLIRNASEGYTDTTSVSAKVLKKKNDYINAPVDIEFDPTKDLIVGANEHFNAIKNALKAATSWIVVHSTFLNEEAFNILRADFISAADRGVKIDLLWGQSETSASRGQTLGAIDRINKLLQTPTVGASIEIHPFSTGSHAKFVLHDHDDNSVSALIGSCNWLASSYNSIEVSIALSDSRIVKKILALAAELARPETGHWSRLSRDLAGNAMNLPDPLNITGKKSFKASIVLAGQLNRYILEARDMAVERIVVCSHRLSTNFQNLILDPMTAAVRGKAISIELYYTLTDVSQGQLNDMASSTANLKKFGTLVIKKVPQRSHAKILYWDSHDVVITSQNPMSADPSEANAFSELGLHLHGKLIAVELAKKMSKFLP